MGFNHCLILKFFCHLLPLHYACLPFSDIIILYHIAAEHLQAQHSAIKMLYNRIKAILEYVKAVRSGAVPINHEIMRDCRSLCQRLPVLDSSQFQEDFFDVSYFYLSELIIRINNCEIFNNASIWVISSILSVDAKNPNNEMSANFFLNKSLSARLKATTRQEANRRERSD